MATQPTSNAVPSESPRDLKFNAGKIDEFATSLALKYQDRFGGEHYTIEGLRWLAQQAIAEFGWIPVNATFQSGATLTQPNQILKDTTDGEYYRWDGVFPKVVPSGSTPSSSGGIGEGAWINTGDAALRYALANAQSVSVGDALIGFRQPFTGAIGKTVHDKLTEIVSPQDFGVIADGRDCTEQINAFVAYVNSIPNLDGMPIGVHFPNGQYKFSQSLTFTRPVHLFGNGALTYTGSSGNWINLGPDNLYRYFLTDKPTSLYYHKKYSVDGLSFVGGTSPDYVINFAHWIICWSVTNCYFMACGGNGAWMINAEYHNWVGNVSDNYFESKNPTHDDDAVFRNFLRTPGFYIGTDGNKYADMWATRTVCENNRLYATGFTHGGIGYLISGWKSRVEGGSSEGMLTDIILATNCNDCDVSEFYMEKNFSPASGQTSRVVQISYDGDAYYDTVKQTSWDTDGNATSVDIPPRRYSSRNKLHQFYGNFKSATLENSFMGVAESKDIAITSVSIKECTFVNYYGVMIAYKDIQENRNWDILGNNFEGSFDVSAMTQMIEPVLATQYKPSYLNRAKNLIKLYDASSVVSGFSGAAPINDYAFGLGNTNLLAQSDGSGGAITLTARNTFNDAAHFYERNKLDMQNRAFQLYCTSPASGQTYLRLAFELDIDQEKIQNNYLTFSFYGLAYTNSVPVSAALRLSSSLITTSGTRSVSVTTDNWRRYSIMLRVADMALGGPAVTADKPRLLLILPASSVFAMDMAAPVVTIGSVAYPLRACI